MITAILTTFGLIVGGIVGFLIAVRRRRSNAAGSRFDVGELPHTLDLLRRANGAFAACLVVPESEPIWIGPDAPKSRVFDQAVSLARLALNDGRVHTLAEGDPQLIAAGNGSAGCALIASASEDGAGRMDQAVADIERLLANFREEKLRRSGVFGFSRDLPEWLNAGPENVEGIAFHLCESTFEVSGRPCFLVLRDLANREAAIAAVSSSADRRSVGTRVSATSAAGRACCGDVPVVGRTTADLLGGQRKDRRSHQSQGMAFPVRDGREGVGALVVLGQPDTLSDRVREHINWLVATAGPKLGRASAVRAAERRAITDELTGLPNRRALDLSFSAHGHGPCALLCVDLDHFKRINDGFGHAAGDAALRKVADVFRRELREDDRPCRIGGEEFALWLPGATANRAIEVAERIRAAVRQAVLAWGGTEIKMTCSIGVAAVPDTVAQADNLLAAADVALYRAKESGRDRVVMAQP